MAQANNPKPRPTDRTVKALFALSGNRCAFPKCVTPAYDTKAKSVLAEICHIEGLQLGSARYRAEQSNDERNEVGNLILLCGTHHKVVDDDEVSYTVARLKEMKAAREAQGGGVEDVAEEAAKALLGNFVAGNVYGNSIVISLNQAGGQTAHTIVNAAVPPRRLGAGVALEVAAGLKKYPPRTCQIMRMNGDPEVAALSDQLCEVLRGGGWTVNVGIDLVGTFRGLQMELRPDGPAAPDDVSLVARALIDAQIMSMQGMVGNPACENLKIVIGYRKEP